MDQHSEPSEGHFAAVFEAAVDAILVIDHMGSIERMNPAVEKMFGWRAAELLLIEELEAKNAELERRIVEVHGGKIWVESKGLGHGTTMYFSLPLA